MGNNTRACDNVEAEISSTMARGTVDQMLAVFRARASVDSTFVRGDEKTGGVQDATREVVMPPGRRDRRVSSRERERFGNVVHAWLV